MSLRQEIKERLHFPILQYIEARREQRTSIKEFGAENPGIASVMEKARKQMQRAALPWLVMGITTFGGLPFLYQHFEGKKERGEITAQQEDIEVQSRYLKNWVQQLRENYGALPESELGTFERILESVENLGNRESLLHDRKVRKKILEEQRTILDWLKKVSVALNAPNGTLEASEAMQNIEIDGKLLEAMHNFEETARKVSEAVQSIERNKRFFDGDKKIKEIIEEIGRGIQMTAEFLRATQEGVETGNFDSIKIEEWQKGKRLKTIEKNPNEKKYLIYLQLCDSRGILESLFQQMMERAKILKERSAMYEGKNFEERKSLIADMLQSMEQKLQRMLEGSDLPLKELAEEFMKILKEFKEIQQEGNDIADQKELFIAIWELNETIDEWMVIREQTTQSLRDIMNATPNQP